MANYEKSETRQVADDSLSITFHRDENNNVLLNVSIPGEPSFIVPWADAYTAANRSTLGPLLLKGVNYALTQKGFTQV